MPHATRFHMNCFRGHTELGRRPMGAEQWLVHVVGVGSRAHRLRRHDHPPTPLRRIAIGGHGRRVSAQAHGAHLCIVDHAFGHRRVLHPLHTHCDLAGYAGIARRRGLGARSRHLGARCHRPTHARCDFGGVAAVAGTGHLEGNV